MRLLLRFLVSLFLVCVLPVSVVHADFGIENYPNFFFEPKHAIGNDWFLSQGSAWSRAMCQYWADGLMEYAPWSVTNKTVMPESGDPRDYLSFAVYYWPDCSNVGNTTVMPDEEVWEKCEYVRRDGEFMPDVGVLVQNRQALINISNSIYLSSLAYVATNDSKYSTHINHALHTFFVNEDTRMNTNLDYAQVVRGPGSHKGHHVGVLDMAVISKIISGVWIMQAMKPPEWKQETEDGLQEWATGMIEWLQTSKLAAAERASGNNHGTFFYNQLSSLLAFVGRYDEAKATLEDFYNGIYLEQIDSSGEQPLEASRTRPYHYRAYNLLGIIINARIGDMIGLDPPGWERKTRYNATMIDALEYAILKNPEDTDELGYKKQYGPVAGSIINRFGDPEGRYSDYLYFIDRYYISEPWYALNENIADHGIKWGILSTTYGPVPTQPPVPALTPTASATDAGRARGIADGILRRSGAAPTTTGSVKTSRSRRGRRGMDLG